MPGVVITTAVRSGPSTTNVAPAATFFVAGTAVRGSTTKANRVTSLQQFEQIYGDYSSSHTLHQHVKTYFEEGGSTAYVGRAVGASATAGAITLNDRSGGAGNPAITITAENPGDWSDNLTVAVVDGTTTNTFIINVYLSGELVYTTGEVLTAKAAVDKINNNTTAGIYITAADLTSGSTTLTTRPKVATATALSGGDDGAAPSEAQKIAALSLFGSELGAGAVAMPENAATSIVNGLIAHAATYNRIALCSFASGTNAATAVATASDFGVGANAEYAAFYFPHVVIPWEGGTTLTVSPESYAAAKRSVAHYKIGPWQPGAGLISEARFVSGLATNIDKTTGNLLDAGRVNALRVIQNKVRIYGARSVSSDTENFRYITGRDLINYIVVQAEQQLEDLVFSAIDSRRILFSQIEGRLIAILEPIRLGGGLYAAVDADTGRQLDNGYKVEVSDAINPVSQLAEGVVKARVGVRVSSVGDTIEVDIYKSNLTDSVI